jgi:endonuclease/exonuclease/phosphatase family metal-dependent hydrolase
MSIQKGITWLRASCIVIFLLIQSFALNISHAAEFSALTYNTWLYPSYFFISKDMKERIQVMPRVLAGTGADIIALQEVWTPSFRDSLTEGMKSLGYPYFAAKDENLGINFIRGWFGNGLMIFSKHPIDQKIDMLSFSGYTRCDEYPTRKGALHVVVQVPGVGKVDVYNTHFGVVSVDEKTGLYDKKELELMRNQARELIQFMNQTAQQKIAVFMGDLNFHPVIWNAETSSYFKDSSHLSPIYSELSQNKVQNQNWIDTFHTLNGLFEPHYTFDVKNNSYLKQGKYADTQSEYLDYLFYYDRENHLKPKKSQLIAHEPVFDFSHGRHLSDHAGIMTTFEY